MRGGLSAPLVVCGNTAAYVRSALPARSHHESSARSPQRRDDELGIVGTDDANRFSPLQPGAADAAGQRGEGAVGHGHPTAGNDERAGTRTIAHVLIEKITQPGDRLGRAYRDLGRATCVGVEINLRWGVVDLGIARRLAYRLRASQGGALLPR